MKTWKNLGNNTAVMRGAEPKVFPVQATVLPGFDKVLDQFLESPFKIVRIRASEKEWFHIETVEPSQEQLQKWQDECLQWESSPDFDLTGIELTKSVRDGIAYVSVLPYGFYRHNGETVESDQTDIGFCLEEAD